LEALRIIQVPAAKNLARVDGLNGTPADVFENLHGIVVADEGPWRCPAMKIPLRMLLILIAVTAVAAPAPAQTRAGVRNRFEVQQLAAADTTEAHAMLAKHFMAVADVYRTDAARYITVAKTYVGNPNHSNGIAVADSWMRKAEDATANANTARAVAAYHLILSMGGTSRRLAGASAFDGGKGAPLPTRAELDELAMAARTPLAHRELAEYFLIMARTETSNAETYARTARMARVSGGRNTETIAARYEYLASIAREAARRADLAVELHRQLAAIG
jgi:hypothetical protein